MASQRGQTWATRPPVGVAIEDVLPRVAALRHMMRDIGHQDSGKPRHASETIRKRPVCPRVPRGFPLGHPPSVTEESENAFGFIEGQSSSLNEPSAV